MRSICQFLLRLNTRLASAESVPPNLQIRQCILEKVLQNQYKTFPSPENLSGILCIFMSLLIPFKKNPEVWLHFICTARTVSCCSFKILSAPFKKKNNLKSKLTFPLNVPFFKKKSLYQNLSAGKCKEELSGRTSRGVNNHK